jgi:hypothetical protein
MNRDFKPSCLADVDMRQYRFDRTSGLPAGYFDRDAWWKPSQDAIVFWIVVAVGLAAIIWSH